MCLYISMGVDVWVCDNECVPIFVAMCIFVCISVSICVIQFVCVNEFVYCVRVFVFVFLCVCA